QGSAWRQFGLLTQVALVLFAVLAASHLAARDRTLLAWLRLMTVAAIAISAYGIAQYFGWDPWLARERYHIGDPPLVIVRPPGTLGYVTYFANWLVFGVYQAVALYRMEANGAWRRIAVAGAALATLAILLSGTRAAMLALLAGTIVLWLLQKGPVGRKTWVAALGALVFLAGFYVSPAGQALRTRMQWFREDTAGGARLYLWRDSLKLVAGKPLGGTGPDGFAPAFAQAQSEGLSRAYPDFYHESPHNLFLDAAASQGLPGLLVLFAAIALGGWMMVTERHRSPLAAPLGACFAAILVTHQFSVFTVPTALTFWIALAMLVAIAPPGHVPPGRARRTGAWLLPVSAVLLLAGLRVIAGDYALDQARRALIGGNLPAAESYRERAHEFGAHADLWYSRKALAMSEASPEIARNIALTQVALRSAERATRTSEDAQNAWLNLALIQAKLNNRAGTEQSIRAAMQAAPNWYRPHLALAKLLLATGRRVDALREAETALRLNPRSIEIQNLAASLHPM
ncbi:MAG: O-antigen ligase family protein, partial [Acidobacteria bacterium]|nr:O-antigen ligase family protein [Acidobacteriota bacterium]